MTEIVSVRMALLEPLTPRSLSVNPSRQLMKLDAVGRFAAEAFNVCDAARYASDDRPRSMRHAIARSRKRVTSRNSAAQPHR